MAKGWYVSNEFKRRLSRLPQKVQKETNKAIEQNADEWVKWSRKLAPVDPKDGIHLRPRQAGRLSAQAVKLPRDQ